MKKNLFYTFIILALVFGFSFFVGTQKTEATDLYYFLMYTRMQSNGVKAPVPSVELSECNKTRTEFMNSAAYLQSKNSNFKEGIYLVPPSVCIKETNPFSPEPNEVQNIEGQNDKPKDDTYTLLAPLGNLKTAPKNIGDYFNIIFNLAIGLCAVLAVVMIVIGGVQYMGDESIFGKTEAKSKIFSAVLGLIIALGSYALLNTINPDLLGKKGVTVETVSVELNRTSGGGYFGVDIGTAGNPNANKNIVTYDTELKAAAKKYGIECTLIKSFMYAESGGVNGKTSPAGASGLIQLMPETFKEQGYDISKIMDPLTNIMAGASYISKLKKNGCNGSSKSSVCDISNIQYLAASYNGGPGANKESKDCSGSTLWRCTKYDGYKETRIYAPRVEANFNKLKEKGWGC
jgi:hypothetical protein